MATIAFFSEPDAWGPLNNCVALAEVLKERGHRVVFVVTKSFAGVLEARGFEERCYSISDPDAGSDVWVQYISDAKVHFQTPTVKQLETVIKPIWQTLVDTNSSAHDRLVEIFAELKPDVIVMDNVSAYPAITESGVPWVRMVSCNPLEIADPGLPPVLSGLPIADRSEWESFRAENARVNGPVQQAFSDYCQTQGAPPLPAGEFQFNSPHLNLYLFAEELDYPREQPLDETWHRLDTTVRIGDEPWSVDEHLPGDGPVIYLSLGSLGSLDVQLMQRLIDILDTQPEYRVIVSMGELADQLTLGKRMTGAAFLPQPSILPQCDLLITHGGNNTVNEAMYYGLPMVVLPLFWDQYDNAQRVDETGFGVRLQTYTFRDEELVAAIERLLADDALKARLAGASARIKANPGRVRGAGLIESLANIPR